MEQVAQSSGAPARVHEARHPSIVVFFATSPVHDDTVVSLLRMRMYSLLFDTTSLRAMAYGHSSAAALGGSCYDR